MLPTIITTNFVDRRIGGLEIRQLRRNLSFLVDRRIGGLEISEHKQSFEDSR